MTGLYFGRSSLRSTYEEPKGILTPVAQPDPYNFKIIKEVSGNNTRQGCGSLSLKELEWLKAYKAEHFGDSDYNGN